MAKVGRVDTLKRRKHLDRQRTLKMARSAHAYVRGNTELFYRWLLDLKPHALPDGPPIWICGDCHVGNLGPLADADGHVDVQIRDLDHTIIGNPAHDLIRLGLSLASAARGSDLPGVTTARILEELISGYTFALHAPGEGDILPEPSAVRSVRRRALGRTWRHLARERIKDVEPIIPLGRNFWALTVKERAAVDRLFRSPHIRKHVLQLNAWDEGDLEVLDAAYWMKGCSSLGKLRYAVLVGISGDKGRKYALVDLKEAVTSVAPLARAAKMPAHHGERVVTGARALSPNLGERMAWADLLGKSIVVRELMPQDLKIELDQFSRGEAVKAARYLAFVVGRAHARQLGPADALAWARELRRRPNDELDAPNWLWSSVVALAAQHEQGYLEHCRRYALAHAA